MGLVIIEKQINFDFNYCHFNKNAFYFNNEINLSYYQKSPYKKSK